MDSTDNVQGKVISKSVRLYLSESDFQKLKGMKINERSVFFKKHAATSSKKPGKKRNRINLSLTDEEMQIIDAIRGTFSRAEIVHANLKAFLITPHQIVDSFSKALTEMSEAIAQEVTPS